MQEEAQATMTAATLSPGKGSQYPAGCWEKLTGWGWGGGTGGGAAEGTTLSSGPAVILEKPIRIPRFLSVKASHVLKGFLNKVRPCGTPAAMAAALPQLLGLRLYHLVC